MDSNTTSDVLHVAVILLMRVLPILDTQISEHSDGFRLQRDILYFLAGNGLPGHLVTRNAEWGGQISVPSPHEAEEVAPGPSACARPRIREARPHG